MTLTADRIFPGLTLEIGVETDGRVIADVQEVPGCMAYGTTEAEAVRAVTVLLYRVLADLAEHDDPLPINIFSIRRGPLLTPERAGGI